MLNHSIKLRFMVVNVLLNCFECLHCDRQKQWPFLRRQPSGKRTNQTPWMEQYSWKHCSRWLYYFGTKCCGKDKHKHTVTQCGSRCYPDQGTCVCVFDKFTPLKNHVYFVDIFYLAECENLNVVCCEQRYKCSIHFFKCKIVSLSDAIC